MSDITHTIAITRTEIRQQIRHRRQQLSTLQQQQASHDLVSQFSQHIHVQSAQHIAIYLHNDGELDTQAVINWCWQQNKHVYIPILHPFSHKQLLFTRLTPTTPLIKNKYGISEPKLDVTQVIPYLDLDLVCSPLVAFDLVGNRLGMGGGYYDRTFSQHQFVRHNQQPPYVIGLAHDCQQHDNLPIAPWDMPIKEIMTPSRTLAFN
ncbi:5-formyltetrahydrofolate cyclo-ligase [Moritella sp. 24]|uniref:5-formyltetrahydrofolate cyclo-ligase n=1 Tax=Moritella sp. 24 TaxID=2746230 RepID=UPI001BA58B6A|nr:5-formyltetrahydrofolate cyclo-ligase [Moritella sp. 24]QUM75511.1 5-formyltetrahydrofolate cyclo-ligase [Moritella sp. 24]